MYDNRIVAVDITNKDTIVAAMVKALAVEIGGWEAATWTATKSELMQHGYIHFNFFNEDKADEFRSAFNKYFDVKFAQLSDKKFITFS